MNYRHFCMKLLEFFKQDSHITYVSAGCGYFIKFRRPCIINLNQVLPFAYNNVRLSNKLSGEWGNGLRSIQCYKCLTTYLNFCLAYSTFPICARYILKK